MTNDTVFRGVSGAFLLFDLTDYETFARLPIWLELISEKCH